MEYGFGVTERGVGVMWSYMKRENSANLVLFGRVFFKYFPPTLASSLLPGTFLFRVPIAFYRAVVELLRLSNGREVIFGRENSSKLVVFDAFS